VITVVAHYTVRADAVATVRDLLGRHAAASQQESGCIQFLAHQALDDPTRFALYEVYESAEAFAAHRETEHFRTNVEGTLLPLLVERSWTTFGPPL
jgi:quinol monooxygenase YgiN